MLLLMLSIAAMCTRRTRSLRKYVNSNCQSALPSSPAKPQGCTGSLTSGLRPLDFETNRHEVLPNMF